MDPFTTTPFVLSREMFCFIIDASEIEKMRPGRRGASPSWPWRYPRASLLAPEACGFGGRTGSDEATSGSQGAGGMEAGEGGRSGGVRGAGGTEEQTDESSQSLL